jgi:hypothetical protein
VNPIRYNEPFNLTAICDIDSYLVDFLETANLEFRINTSIGWQTYTIPISENQTVTYPICDALLYRGVHQVRATLVINGTSLASQEDLIAIHGYTSVIDINDQAGVQLRSLTIPFEGGTNATGPLHLYVYLEQRWILLGTVQFPTESFQVRPDWGAGDFLMKVNWSGTGTTEPCEVQFTLTVTPDYFIIGLACVGGMAAIATTVLTIYTHQRRRKAKAQERAAILAECEREHGVRRLASGLQAEFSGRPTDEPEVLEHEEGEPDILR